MPESTSILAEGGVNLLTGMALLGLAAFLLGFVALLIGWFIRRQLPHPDKNIAYECGEVPVGPARVQFGPRFYVVALVFLVFDVEIALFYPWAVVYGQEALASLRPVALWDMLVFFGVIVVGFVYLWRMGYLDWVRAVAGQSRPEQRATDEAPSR